MTQSPRITLKIDRILTEGAPLDRAALEAALHQALTDRFLAHGRDGFGPSRNLAAARGDLAGGASPLAVRVARAVVGTSAGETP